jgi:DNA-binding XRE family transcriptional regulator
MFLAASALGPAAGGVVEGSKMQSAAFPSAVSYRLKLARTGAGLTKSGMAKALGVSRLKYAAIERSGVIPPELMTSICVVTRCSPVYLLKGTRSETPDYRVIQHGNVTVRLNPCGGPCTAGPFWCQEGCLIAGKRQAEH